MIAALAEFGGFAQSWLAAAWAVFLRLGAAMAILPAFGEQNVPLRFRLALTLCFCAILLPAALPFLMSNAEIANGSFPALFWISEPLVGLILGLGLRFFILALQIAGTIAAQATSLSQLFGSASVEPQPAISHLLVVAALALAALGGLHVKIVALFLVFYELFPPGTLPTESDLARWGVEQGVTVLKLAFSLAAPFVIASLTYNLTLGVINRAMPQLMVAFVGAPAITAGALLLLLITSPLMLLEWQRQFDLFLANPIGAR